MYFSAALVVSVLICLPAASFAQSSNADQLQSIFNGLSPEQQQQLLQQYGNGAQSSGSGLTGGAAAATGNGTSGNTNYQGSVSRPNGQATAEQDARGRGSQGGERQFSRNGAPLLRASDTVLIDISLQKPRSDSTLALPSSTSGDNGVPRGAQTSPLPAENGSGASNGAASEQDLGEGPSNVGDPAAGEDLKHLAALVGLIRLKSPYTLDRSGALLLPGFAPIPLAGLTEALATRRIAAEPGLARLYVKLTLLPLTQTGTASLKPYGYDLFSGSNPGFAPSMDSPIPADYEVGPGDTFSVQLFGSQNRTFQLVVTRDGRVAFPELGPINVAGRRFSEVQAEIEGRISRQMIGVHGSVSMGSVRAIRIFVVGEVTAPGSYTVSGLSTMTGALFASGGVRSIGSLRDVELKRAGRVVSHLDLYELMLRGDTGNDVHLLPGDVIFVPTIGATASVDGEVRRPGIYELRGATDAQMLIDMAGGFTTEADAKRGALERVDDRQRRVVIGVDFSSPDAGMQLRNGDALRVARLRPTLDAGIVVQGQVFRPGAFAWSEGLRLSDVIGSINELKPNADKHYLLIRREVLPDRRITALSADLAAALKDPASAANVLLEPHDQITVFDLEAGRDRILRPLMDELRMQSNLAAPAQTVTVSGRVKVPGDYPLEMGMRVSDLVRAGGSLDDAAYGGTAELSRYAFENGQTRRTQVIQINLAAALRGDADSNLLLEPYDGLYVKEISGWSEQDEVTLAGEVRFPGTYPIKRGETLKSVIDRAGGLTDLAFAGGSVFTRAQLRLREQQEIDRLADRMQNELAASALMAARSNQTGATQTFSIGQSLLSQLKATKAVGRLVIDMDAALNAKSGSSDDIVLKSGDTLTIPRRSQEVTVIGEVQNVSSQLYQPNLTRDDYVRLSGGTTRMADQGRIYVVRADGSVLAGKSRWLKSGSSAVIRPGDTIVVPMDTERVPALPLWQSVTTILYNIAIAVAAIHSL